MGDKPRVAIYCRVASLEQADEQLMEQEKILRMYSDMMGYEVVLNTRDAGRCDALVQPGFKAAMDAVKAKQFDILLMKDLSRFSRDMGKAQALQSYMVEHGAQVKTLDAELQKKLLEQLQKAGNSKKDVPMVKSITTSELARMSGQEGLVLQGCGGDLTEWVEGINRELTEAGALVNGGTLNKALSFQHDGFTNLIFPLDETEHVNMGKLAFWRLQTHNQFGGTWLSDYLPNRLGIGAEPELVGSACANKPKAPLLGADGNVF